MQTERLAAEIAKTDPEAAKHTPSPAADLADYRTKKMKKEPAGEAEVKAEDIKQEEEGKPNEEKSGIKSEIKSEIKCEESESKQM